MNMQDNAIIFVMEIVYSKKGSFTVICQEKDIKSMD